MMKVWRTIGAAVVVASAAPGLGAAQTLTDREQTCADSLKVQNHVLFREGRLRARECALDLLRQDMDVTEPLSTHRVARHAGYLGRAYALRAQRQQTFLDSGSLVTFGSAAAAFEGGISASTRQAWTIAALVPSIISRFNANEPTRELFHGAALAVHLMTVRQTRIDRALAGLKSSSKAVECGAFRQSVAAVTARRADRKAATFDSEGVLLNEARRLATACGTLARRQAALRVLVDQLETLSQLRAADFAADLVAFDNAVLAKDRDLRYTPVETIGLIVSSPLRSVDLLVSGENTQTAVDSLKTQIAFAGLNRSLATIPVPAPGPVPASTLNTTLSGAAEAMESSALPQADADLISDLRAAAGTLEDSRLTMEMTERTAADLVGALSATELTFSFDVTNGTTLVRLAPPAPAAMTANTSSPPSS